MGARHGLSRPPTGTQLCNGGPDSSLLVNPLSSPPAGAVTVPAGDDSTLAMSNGKIVTQNFGIDPGTVYWFAAGTHTLGSSNFGQIDPKANDVFEGAPGAIINGEGINQSAFDGTASGVTIEYLTVENFVPGTDAIAVNHDSGPNWTIQLQHHQVQHRGRGGAGLGRRRHRELPGGQRPVRLQRRELEPGVEHLDHQQRDRLPTTPTAPTTRTPTWSATPWPTTWPPS